MMTNSSPLSARPQSTQAHRGSRERCLLLTDGTDTEVAARLTAIVAPHAYVDAQRHTWMPKGHSQPAEAKLGESFHFLDEQQRENITKWWLTVRRGANTPNWDMVSQATFAGEDGTQEGLILVEAKAHDRELSMGGKTQPADASDNSDSNQQRIAAAISDANSALNAATPQWKPGWNLSHDSHYQLANRFAWSWKIASMGIPVILVYLGFLQASEMSDCGAPFVDAADWERVVMEYAKGIVPRMAWQQSILIPCSTRSIPLVATIRSAR